ncbi:MAG: hypothetical protein HY279_07495 [Nitrospinae bacterium]|nr:hypothetical protein [Nitrospinota bacterium]
MDESSLVLHPSSLVNMSFKIPEKNGEFLCIPPPALIPQLIKSNKERFKAYNFYIDELNVHYFRKRVREKVLRLSQQYTSALAIPPPLNKGGKGKVADTIILTGHQPIFYHPGILVKNLLLNKVGREENITAINLIVDTDNFKEITVNIPTYNNGNKINRETFLSNPSPIPYELSPAPSWETFRSFIKGIDEDLSHHQLKNLYENFSEFVKKVGNPPFPPLTSPFSPPSEGGEGEVKKGGEGGLSDFMTFIRRKYEEEIGSQYLEIPLSKICNTDEFIAFFISIVREAESFVLVYNYHLGQYRKGHKLRYPVNPFPDLSVDNKRLELPFWHFNFPPARGRIFVEYKDGVTTICFEKPVPASLPSNVFIEGFKQGGVEISFKNGETEKAIEIIKKNKIKIRPRAITLTLFNRMFVSDVFIHGVGGAKYDRITDGIIRDFYKVEPPDFITASLTLYPAIPLPVAQGFSPDLIKKLERSLRDMRYNPERYVIPFTPPLEKGGWGDLIKKKEYLISLLKEDYIHKKEISIRLREINEMLYQKIKPAVNEIEEKIKVLTKQQQEIEAIQRRDYPYFLFSPEEIMKRLPDLNGSAG